MRWLGQIAISSNILYIVVLLEQEHNSINQGLWFGGALIVSETSGTSISISAGRTREGIGDVATILTGRIMKAEKRRRRRIKVPVPVLVTHHTLGSAEFVTLDISDIGLFLKAPSHQCPPIGDEITLQIKSGILADGDDPQPIRAQIVHVTENGMGVEFL